jgi:hypothetical protein
MTNTQYNYQIGGKPKAKEPKKLSAGPLSNKQTVNPKNIKTNNLLDAVRIVVSSIAPI